MNIHIFYAKYGTRYLSDRPANDIKANGTRNLSTKYKISRRIKCNH